MEEKLQQLGDQLFQMATTVGGKIITVILVVVIGRVLIKTLMKFLRNGRAFQRMEPTVSHFLQSFLNITLNILLAVTVISILGVPMTSVVAVIASAGVTIGLALQGALSNLAGGIMILIFRPFRLDNFIESSGFSGTVKDIGIFYTTLLTPDNKIVTIPNGTVMGSSVINYSINDTRRVDLTFSAAYRSDVEKVKAILLDEASKNSSVLKDPAPFARLTKQNNSSLDFTLRVWVKKDDYWQVNFDMLEAVNNRFVKEGIEIPFNQLDVHVTEKP